DDAATGRSVDLGVTQLALDALHLLLHLLGHALQVAHPHWFDPPRVTRPAESGGSRRRLHDGGQDTSPTSTRSSAKIRRASLIRSAASPTGTAGTSSRFVATQRTLTARPRTRPMPSSSIDRRRSRRSFRNALSSGNPRVTSGPSTVTGRHSTISGLIGGLWLSSATISGHLARRRSTPPSAGVVGAAAAGVSTGAAGSGVLGGAPAATSVPGSVPFVGATGVFGASSGG